MMLNRPMSAMVHAGVGPEPSVHEVGRQVHGDEGKLEAAGEETHHQQHVAPVAEGFDECLTRRLRFHGRRRRRRLRRRKRERQRQHQKDRSCKDESVVCQENAWINAAASGE